MNSQQIEQVGDIADAAPAPSPTKPLRRYNGGKTDKSPTAPGKRAAKAKQATAGRKKAAGTRNGTKQEQLIGLLRRPDGASVGEVVKALAWQPHTVRGAISGALKKRLALKITSAKIEGRGRVYRIEAK